MPIVAETERLIIRTWKRGDRKKYAEVCNTDEVMRYLGGVQSDFALKEDVKWFKDCHEDYGYSLWALEHKETREFLGFCGLDHLLCQVPDHLLDMTEIGWRLRQDYWGQGLATEAARMVLKIAFEIRRLPEVISRTDEGNAASIAMMRKLRLEPAPDLEPGKGLVAYRLRRADWLGC